MGKIAEKLTTAKTRKNGAALDEAQRVSISIQYATNHLNKLTAALSGTGMDQADKAAIVARMKPVVDAFVKSFPKA